MKIQVGADGKKIGENNQITEAMRTGDWNVRVGFVDEQCYSRFEVSLTVVEAEDLIKRIKKAISSIQQVQKEFHHAAKV